MNARKNTILLRSRVIAVTLSCALLLCSMALPASAANAVLDYNDYITDITVSGENDNVMISTPGGVWFGGGQAGYSTDGISNCTSSSFMSVYYYPYRQTDGTEGVFPRSDFPDDTVFTIMFECATQNTPRQSYMYFTQYDENMKVVSSTYVGLSTTVTGESLEKSWVVARNNFTLPFVEECAYFTVGYEFSTYGVASDLADTGGVVYWYIFDSAEFLMNFSINSLVRQQNNTNKTNNILQAVENQLAENGQTLEEVLQQQQQTNDKLDDVQGSIETLPGQIGDEMQGVIDQEKNEANSEGNKFVDQILDALPDPSADVLVALKSLTDATAYTGTDAVLPIPAIVLPGIDGLFSGVEIWGGAEFDFGEYIGMLPPTLLTLVQALFTIAIVLYCVYELKGIISYCLTLRESKGG